jgi:hypothetical protein
MATKQPQPKLFSQTPLVCPNCHRELHYGATVSVLPDGEFNVVQLANVTTRIHKNTITFLESRDA